jgi:peptide/nickel transport system permease protein
MDSHNTLIERGIAASKAGDTNTARQLLAEAARQNPGSDRAWLWLGAVLTTPQGRAFCLRQALAANPANLAARQGLDALENVPRAPALVAQAPAAALASPVVVPAPSSAEVPQARAESEPVAKPPASTFARVARYSLVRLVTLCLMVAIGVYLAVVIINFGGFVDDMIRDRISQTLMGMGMGMQGVSPEQMSETLAQAEQHMIEAYGLNEPFLLRCARWTWLGLTFDWGEQTTFIVGQPIQSDVAHQILAALPNTLLLAGAANLLLFFVTLFFALFLSRRYGSLLDRLIIALSPISSAPNWVFGILLTLIFAAELGVLPYGGKYDTMPPSTQFGYVFVVLRHMILPVAAIFLSLFFQGVYAWRTYFLLHSGEDYVEMAEAQGLPSRMIERRYILRPSLPYVVTSFTLMVIAFWQGTMALEMFFRWPGIGWLFIQAVHAPMRNRMTTVALVVVFAYLLAISVFVLDILYALVDPRIKLGGGNRTAERAVRKKTRLRLRPNRATVSPSRQRWHSPLPSTPAGVDSPRLTWGQRLKKRGRALAPVLRDMRRYPSAVLGLVIIVLLIGVSIYTVITIPYSQAVDRWRVEREALYRNPKNAQPEWTNLFRRDDLPPSIILDSQVDTPQTGGTVSKTVEVVSENMTEITLSYRFDYPYAGFPQNIGLYFTTHYESKIPLASPVLLTPDGREIKLQSFNVTPGYAYLVSSDTRMQRQDPLLGKPGPPMQVLFADPGVEPPVSVKGTYEMRVTGYVFEPDADLDAEFVLYGQVFGWAGTDNYRRDLSVALLWGAPVALVFGLVGALATSLLTMSIAAVGVWFGGAVDHLIQRITEVNMILPALPLAITVYYLYAKSVWVILGVMVLLSIFGSSLKNYRAIFVQVKESPYIEAAQVYGATNRRIVFRYLVPRIMPVLIPQLVILIPGYVFLEATLAFLGVSDIYLPTWGKVIADALTNSVFEGYYYWILEPITLLMITGLAFAMVGFALDRILNPRLRRR